MRMERIEARWSHVVGFVVLVMALIEPWVCHHFVAAEAQLFHRHYQVPPRKGPGKTRV